MTAARSDAALLAALSREIRTPLNAILDLSRLTLSTELDAGQRDYVENVQSAAQALLSVINDGLDDSRLEAGPATGSAPASAKGTIARSRRGDVAPPAIDIPSALERVGGARAVLVQLLDDFAAGFAAAPTQILAALHRGDLEGARRQVYTLKGTAGTLSVTKVYAAAIAVEKAIRAGNVERAVTLLEPLDLALGLAVQAVSALRAQESAAGAAAPNDFNGERTGYTGGDRDPGVSRERETTHE